MKKSFISFIFVLCSVALFAWTSPVDIPNVGNARLRIVGQNVENYLTNFEASNASCSNQTQFDAKTNKMANVFLALNADIIALCEVQQNDQILGYICTAMNNIAGGNNYTYVTDGLSSTTASAGYYQYIKCGYIYRSDKVTPVGKSTSPATDKTYKPRMRLQVFKENSTNETFMLSVNHFKAKDSSADKGEATRLGNAATLLTALQDFHEDPDILIVGDLNAMTGEQPIQNIISAGYEEQLVRFDANAYSYVYNGSRELIDHTLANPSMASQISGAYVYHINTGTSKYSEYHYSDHDAYVIGLNLGDAPIGPGAGCESVNSTLPARKVLRDGQLYIEIEGILYTITGYPVRK